MSRLFKRSVAIRSMTSIDTSQAASLTRIPADIQAMLTLEQCTRLDNLLARPGRHGMAWRASTRLFGRRFYLVLLSGREGRSPARLRHDGMAMSLFALLARIVGVAAWITVAFALCAVAGVGMLYVVKSHLGIDLIDGPSLLHDYFF